MVALASAGIALVTASLALGQSSSSSSSSGGAAAASASAGGAGGASSSSSSSSSAGGGGGQQQQQQQQGGGGSVIVVGGGGGSFSSTTFGVAQPVLTTGVGSVEETQVFTPPQELQLVPESTFTPPQVIYTPPSTRTYVARRAPFQPPIRRGPLPFSGIEVSLGVIGGLALLGSGLLLVFFRGRDRTLEHALVRQELALAARLRDV